MDIPEEEAEEGVPIPMPPVIARQGPPQMAPQEAPPQWFARPECLQKGFQDVQYEIVGTPEDEQ
ncbi:UNVERIFIED_CONTAM: hypothetical protein Sradi_4874700 [Sesamum radiatum]|uniref:Uncharacterized protein n=1 Tax=Sesamum radiatum TaxID=300843 RepID=A0AAW2N0T3_SESRA